MGSRQERKTAAYAEKFQITNQRAKSGISADLCSEEVPPTIGVTYSRKCRERAIITPIQIPQAAPRMRPTAALNKVIVRFLVISPPLNKSASAAATAPGAGRKSLLTTPAAQMVCHISPKRIRGATRTSPRLAANINWSGFVIMLSGGQGLTPHRQPDAVADAIELLGDNELFTRTATVGGDGEFLYNLTGSGRHDANTVREIDRLGNVVGYHADRLAGVQPERQELTL